MRTMDKFLPQEAAARLVAYRRAVEAALPGVERVILFGSRARGDAREDSDYDVAVIVSDLSDRWGVMSVLSGLAYDDMLDGFDIRPIPHPLDYLRPEGRPTELAEDIARDGIDLR